MGNLKYDFKSAISDELLDEILRLQFYWKLAIGFTQKGSNLKIIARFACMDRDYMHDANIINWKSLLIDDLH